MHICTVVSFTWQWFHKYITNDKYWGKQIYNWCVLVVVSIFPITEPFFFGISVLHCHSNILVIWSRKYFFLSLKNKQRWITSILLIRAHCLWNLLCKKLIGLKQQTNRKLLLFIWSSTDKLPKTAAAYFFLKIQTSFTNFIVEK